VSIRRASRTDTNDGHEGRCDCLSSTNTGFVRCGGLKTTPAVPSADKSDKTLTLRFFSSGLKVYTRHPVTQNTPQILLVEDNTELLSTLTRFFQRQGYTVFSTRSGEEAVEIALSHRPDIAVMDVMLHEGPGGPLGMDGFEACRAIRDRGFDRPVLFLTAKLAEQDTLQGFAAGGDDYITKPFSLLELKARIDANLRRAGLSHRLYNFGELEIDLERYTIRHPNHIERLRSRERDLLRCFIENRGRILSRESLLEQVWGSALHTSNRTVDTHVRTLRKKLRDDAHQPRFIETLHGVGYQFIAKEKDAGS